jgi:hypothetical protein
MKRTPFTKQNIFIALIFLSAVSHAEEIGVMGLSEGSCWYQEDEVLKIASFNDKESFVGRRDHVENEINDIVSKKLGKSMQKSDSELFLHCSSMGASLVAKVKFNETPLCVWTKFSKGKLSLRSLGGDTASFNKLCDGYTLGEVIVGLRDKGTSFFDSQLFHSVAKSMTEISLGSYKLILKDEFFGRENEVLEMLKKSEDFKDEIRYVELSEIMHPVGEYTPLK